MSPQLVVLLSCRAWSEVLDGCLLTRAISIANQFAGIKLRK